MQSQKIENMLNLALMATEEEREKSLEMDIGYDRIDKVWELIVKYSGNLDLVRSIADQVIELLNEYAIIRIRESLIERLAELPQIEYIEKPKRLFFQAVNGKRVSCINEVQGTRFSLFGQGVLLAVIDSGIDYRLPIFRKPDGTTKIRCLWDQTSQAGNAVSSDGTSEANEAFDNRNRMEVNTSVDSQIPAEYGIGVEYSRTNINEALEAIENQGIEAGYEIVPARDFSGHGTAVAGIAAGIATESELIVVKLGNPAQDGFPRTTELMLGVDYAIRRALEYRMPVAMNISFGNTYGSHDGTSLLERYLDDVANIWKSSICIGTGNEASGSGHASGVLSDSEDAEIELAVQEYQPGINIQIWKQYIDQVDILLVTPSGVVVGPLREILGVQRYTVGQTNILLYYGKPSPYSTDQEIFIELLPRINYIASGEWKVILIPRKIISGEYHLWLPSEGTLNAGTGFRFPSSTSTITIPATAARTIGVGAYDARTSAYADFSGRGPLTGESGNVVKPDLAAPGVEVQTVAVGGGEMTVSGTSFATPFVTGSAALLMEWGIVRGNDPYLYGEKVKAYLRRGAKPLPGYTQYPNPQVGYGALCVRNSIPEEY